MALSTTTPSTTMIHHLNSNGIPPRVLVVDSSNDPMVVADDDDDCEQHHNDEYDDEEERSTAIESGKTVLSTATATTTSTSVHNTALFVQEDTIHCLHSETSTSSTEPHNIETTTKTTASHRVGQRRASDPISHSIPSGAASPQSFTTTVVPSITTAAEPTTTGTPRSHVQRVTSPESVSDVSPIPLILQPPASRKYVPTLDILRSLSSSTMDPITKSQSADPDYDRGSSSIHRVTSNELTSHHHQIPRRNLTEAFEEMYSSKPRSSSSLNNSNNNKSGRHHSHHQPRGHVRHHKTCSSTASDDTRTTSATTVDTELLRHDRSPLLSSGTMPHHTSSTKIRDAVANMISPTGVTELQLNRSNLPSIQSPSHSSAEAADLVVGDGKDVDAVDEEELALKQREAPEFKLHPLLQRKMSDALVERVSFYAIIHDINKEASVMAASDDSGYVPGSDAPTMADEGQDPIVLVAHGKDTPASVGSKNNGTRADSHTAALIDEEVWLLDVIESRSPDEARSPNDAACPPTFLQAMGERDYENPVASLSSGTRTQLWKPSRSWWEAKSGKNPWIEPRCHNKRWRYLWPLIHYHKFLAKCIKKLKRNGVDVKVSVSPVSAFLREEVCAVSDHLAAVSLFDSDTWMTCLHHFFGWTESTKAAEDKSRKAVSELKLRALREPGDIDSPLLRNQVDEQYLRAMANARSQLTSSGMSNESKRLPKETARRRDSINSSSKQMSSVSSTSQVRQITNGTGQRPRRGLQATPHKRQQFQGYPNTGWWHPGWHPHAPYPFPDEQSSVHSALSSDSYSHGYMNGFHLHPAVGFHQNPYYPPMMYAHPQMMPGSQNASYDGSAYSHEMYNHHQMVGGGWAGHVEMNMATNQVDDFSSGVPSTPARQNLSHQEINNGFAAQDDGSGGVNASFHTPYKYDPNQVNSSPYWNHLQDQATLSMMGLATPQAAAPAAPAAPSTPLHQGPGNSAAMYSMDSSSHGDNKASAAQPLLLRQQYYGYGYGAREGYAPPSPATQFMMSPQSGLSYNYAYGYSPRRPTSRSNGATISEEDNDTRNDVSEASEPFTPPALAPTKRRQSPDQIVSNEGSAAVAGVIDE